MLARRLSFTFLFCVSFSLPAIRASEAASSTITVVFPRAHVAAMSIVPTITDKVSRCLGAVSTALKAIGSPSAKDQLIALHELAHQAIIAGFSFDLQGLTSALTSITAGAQPSIDQLKTVASSLVGDISRIDAQIQVVTESPHFAHDSVDVKGKLDELKAAIQALYAGNLDGLRPALSLIQGRLATMSAASQG